MGNCCTNREDDDTPPTSSRSPRPSARRHDAGNGNATELKGSEKVESVSLLRKGDAKDEKGGEVWTEATKDQKGTETIEGNSLPGGEVRTDPTNERKGTDTSETDSLSLARLRRSSCSEGAGMEVNLHRVAMLTLKKDVSNKQLEHLQAVLKACVEYVPGLVRWTFQPLLPDTEGLGGGHTHAMYLAFEDEKSLDKFEDNPKHLEVEALISPLLVEDEDSLLVFSWEQCIHLKRSGVDRLAVFKASDEEKLLEVLKEESECCKEVSGYKLCHYGPHHDEKYSLNKDFNYGFYASFENVEALETYRAHPKHKAVREKLVECLDGPIGPHTMMCVSYALA